MKKEVKREIDEVSNLRPQDQVCAIGRDQLLRTMYWM
jgi:hypothetical protein